MRSNLAQCVARWVLTDRYRAFRYNLPLALLTLLPWWKQNKTGWGCDLDEGKSRDNGRTVPSQ